jgi:DNA-binding LacI/PurR family transcriptional regulator
MPGTIEDMPPPGASSTPDTAIPDKARALRDLLVDELRRGLRPAGTRLPSEWELARSCGVSRTTVRSALAELTAAGLLVRQQGRGTFVHQQADQRLSGPRASELLVAVVLPSQRLVNPIFQAVLARFAERLDPRARLQFHHHDFLKPAIYADSGAGLVIADGGYGAEAVLALQARCPQLVLLNRLHRELPAVCTDNRLGGELMAEHLLGLGHRRIGILHYGAEGTEEEFVLRLRGIRHVLKAAGVEPLEAALQLHNQRAFTPFQAVELLRRRASDLTALLCMTDVLALNALEALEETGVAVPGRISIIGFDDLRACRFSVPALTTIRQPVCELGDALADAVAARLAGGDLPRPRPLKPQLVARASVADLSTGKQP